MNERNIGDEIIKLNNIKVRKVLIVEDNKINSVILSRILQKYSFDVYVAEDGLVGLEAVKSYIPDLVLMDLNMPVMNGYDSCIEIRKLQEPLKNVPIFAVTAELTPKTQNKVKEVGMNEFFSKPIDIDELLIKILEYL